MAAARSLPPWVVLDRLVDVNSEDEPGWEIIKCARRKAIGCGDDGASVVEGFTLMAFLADPPGLSALRICASDAVLRARGIVRVAQVIVAEKDLIVISICFRNFSDGYYLIFDATDASLTMTPKLRRSNPEFDYMGTVDSMYPLPFRHFDGRCALVHMAKSMERQEGEGGMVFRHFLCLWPPLSASSQSSSSKTVPWQLKEPLYPQEIPPPSEDPFSFRQMFSHDSKAFWVDPSKGVLYCQHKYLLSGEPVPFHLMELPRDLTVVDVEDAEGTNMFRTMGCSGDSIRFVSIDRHRSPGKAGLADCNVTMWTLMPNFWEWKKVSMLRFGDLWKQSEFAKLGLPASTELMVPMLSSEEDGVVYLVLRDDYVDGMFIRCREQHILRVDMLRKRLLSSTRLPSFDHLYLLQIFGSDFFKHLDSQLLSPLAVPAEESVLSKRKKLV